MGILILLILAVPTVISLILKARIEFPPDPEIHWENDVERALKEAEADEKFEATLQRTLRQKKASMRPEKIRTPEEAGYQIAPWRDRVVWKPDLPGIVHEEDRDWSV
ncbi:MAG: hypothetical protein O3C45_08065 [Bacteroidetes bacterium]|nr:hypothetical protein [Bacteroidota bacterium]MDA0875000.1 hypothetical protein [Bacteroidota bacterium]